MSIFAYFISLMAKATNLKEEWMAGYGRGMLSHIGALDSITELSALMRDYDGYARQAAIDRSVILSHPGLLPAIAERLNDWVPQVRDAARSAILMLLPRMPVPEVVKVLPAIMKLRSAGRYDHSDWLVQFERALLDRVHADDLIAGVNGSDIKIARACFGVLQRAAVVDESALILSALSSRRDIVMARQAAALIANLPQEGQVALYNAALRSHFGAVRIFAIRAMLRLPARDAAHDLAISVLFDPQSSVRDAAINHLLAGAIDVGSCYRIALATDSTPPAILRIALASLGNLRNAGDVSLVRQFCRHPMPSVRLCAYTAWFRIAQGDKDLVAQEAILDEARSVKKAALEMFVKHGAFIPLGTVCESLRAPANRDLLARFVAQSGQTLPAGT